jgi:hypothetical protein
MRALLFVMLVCGAFTSQLAEAAYVVAVSGMPPMGVSAPLNPVNGAQCEAFAKESNAYQNRIGEWHQQCLDDNKGCSSNRGKQCSCAACEGLHVARDRFAKESHDEGKACFDAVSRVRQSIQASLETSEGASAVQSALLAGVNSTALSLVRKQIAELFAKESQNPSAKNLAARVAQSSARIAKSAQYIRANCHQQVSLQAGAECEKQMLLAVRETQFLGTANNSVFVRAVQKNAFLWLEQSNRRTLEPFRGPLSDRILEQPPQESGQTLGK